MKPKNINNNVPKSQISRLFHIHTSALLPLSIANILVISILPFRPSCDDHHPISQNPPILLSPAAHLPGPPHGVPPQGKIQMLLQCQVQTVQGDLCMIAKMLEQRWVGLCGLLRLC